MVVERSDVQQLYEDVVEERDTITQDKDRLTTELQQLQYSLQQSQQELQQTQSRFVYNCQQFTVFVCHVYISSEINMRNLIAGESNLLLRTLIKYLFLKILSVTYQYYSFHFTVFCWYINTICFKLKVSIIDKNRQESIQKRL